MTKSKDEAQYTALIEEAEEGGFVAQCVEIPTAIAQGETFEDVAHNMAFTIGAIIRVKRSLAQAEIDKAEKEAKKLFGRRRNAGKAMHFAPRLEPIALS